MTTYTSRNEAIAREITAPLGEYADEFDIDAIADEVLETIGEGNEYRYQAREDVDFWEIVEKHAL